MHRRFCQGGGLPGLDARRALDKLPATGSPGTPWDRVQRTLKTTNLEVEKADSASNYAFYRELLAFRHGREAFGTGALSVYIADNPSVLWYARTSSDEKVG
ncbi:MAG: hypothetical protein U0263_39685 [Polyangiaceae bacterium]